MGFMCVFKALIFIIKYTVSCANIFIYNMTEFAQKIVYLIMKISLCERVFLNLVLRIVLFVPRK
jgi:hypothetical protein